jgi:hypothetical protein
VGTNIGAFHSAPGQSPWTYFDFGLHPTFFTSFALHDGIVLVHFANPEGTGVEFSTDDGTTWQVLDRMPGVFTYEIASIGSLLYAGRVDGLWRRSIADVSVPAGGPAASLGFRVAGPNPIRDQARFRIELPEAGRVRVDLFDVAGRRVPGGIDETLPAGANDVSWNAGGLAPGVYLARLVVRGSTKSVRLVRVH